MSIAGYTLAHHGIKGQQWGVRRFQNADGTLTDRGRKRYNKAVYKEVVARTSMGRPLAKGKLINEAIENVRSKKSKNIEKDIEDKVQEILGKYSNKKMNKTPVSNRVNEAMLSYLKKSKIEMPRTEDIMSAEFRQALGGPQTVAWGVGPALKLIYTNFSKKYEDFDEESGKTLLQRLARYDEDVLKSINVSEEKKGRNVVKK